MRVGFANFPRPRTGRSRAAFFVSLVAAGNLSFFLVHFTADGGRKISPNLDTRARRLI